MRPPITHEQWVQITTVVAPKEAVFILGVLDLAPPDFHRDYPAARELGICVCEHSFARHTGSNLPHEGGACEVAGCPCMIWASKDCGAQTTVAASTYTFNRPWNHTGDHAHIGGRGLAIESWTSTDDAK